MQKYVVAIIVILVLTVLFLLGYLGIQFFITLDFSNALKYAITNDTFCDQNKSMCNVQINDNLPFGQLGKEFNATVARYLLDLIARISYYYPNSGSFANLLSMPNGLSLIKTLYTNLSVKKTIGYLATDGSGTLFIVFRGTQSLEELEADFDFKQSSLNAQTTKLFLTSVNSNILCHSGFLNIYSSIRDSILSEVKKGYTAIVITGHSLGSALATLATFDCSSYSPCFTYVFASPRVCNKEFANFISGNENIRCFFRVTNTSDVIPTVPLSVTPNLANNNQPYIFEDVGNSRIFTDNRLSLQNNHLLPVYVYNIKNAGP